MVHAFGTAPRAGAGEPHYDEVTAAWKQVTGEDITAGTPLWVNRFDDENRRLARYRHGRILFAGDAAHRQMPIGGQALNLGLQDAYNLGWKLAAAVDRTAPAGLLDSYHTERTAVGAAVLGNIRAQALLLLGGPDIEPLRTVLAELLTHEAVRTQQAAMISGLDIRYDVGGPAHPLHGMRLPPTDLRTGAARCTTADLLRSGRGLLLALDGPPPPMNTALADRIDTVTAQTEPGSPLNAGAVLVRPDGYVAWAGAADGAGLAEAAQRWFGSP
jgi:oxygenase